VMLEKWMAFNNVSVTETNRLLDTITEVKANHPDHESKIHYYLIDDYPHDWPISPNPNELGIEPFMSASDYIVDFLILPNTE